jgi:hypothetical protein
VEIDQKPQRDIQKPEMREELSFIHRVKRIFALEFDNNPAVDDKVGAEATIKFDGFIKERNCPLPFNSFA